jgi:signal transduction histidine kinase
VTSSGEAAVAHTALAEAHDLLSFIAEGTAGTVGEEFFECLAKHLALAFRADVGFVAEVIPQDRARARFLACWESGRIAAEPFEYVMAGTPCAEVAGSDIVSYSDGLAARFPQDEMVVEMGLESYLAVALRGSGGQHIGHLGVLAATPLHPDDEKVAVMRIFAARAASELERRLHERALREREASHRALAEEQAALRRVATLVAAEASEQDVLDAVAAETGRLLGADIASLVRYDDSALEIRAGWSESPERSVPKGIVVDIDGATATKVALQRGVPARADDIDDIAGAAPVLRELGIRSAVAAPIKVGGRMWGAVTAARTREESFPAGAEQRLGEFAELVAQAVANAQARQQLEASRVRIVEASDAERRRIERNLHDGAQQRLVSLALALRMAEAKVRDDAEVGQMLSQASEELASTLAELREIARGIHPAVLTERGLAPAMEALAARAPIPVDVVLEPVGRLPEAVEATAYYVVAEALTNVAKYAEATAASVMVTCPDGRLCIEVRDDGVGGADIGRGSGLRGLADRVEAVGGTLEVESRAGEGTVVAAMIPVAPAPSR